MESGYNVCKMWLAALFVQNCPTLQTNHTGEMYGNNVGTVQGVFSAYINAISEHVGG